MVSQLPEIMEYIFTLRLHYIPRCWKHPISIPISKAQKDPQLLYNLWPISLLNGTAQLLETYLMDMDSPEYYIGDGLS